MFKEQTCKAIAWSLSNFKIGDFQKPDCWKKLHADLSKENRELLRVSYITLKKFVTQQLIFDVKINKFKQPNEIVKKICYPFLVPLLQIKVNVINTSVRNNYCNVISSEKFERQLDIALYLIKVKSQFYDENLWKRLHEIVQKYPNDYYTININQPGYGFTEKQKAALNSYVYKDRDKIKRTEINLGDTAIREKDKWIIRKTSEVQKPRINEINKDDDRNENIDIWYGQTSINNNKKLKPIYEVESKTLNNSKEVTHSSYREQILHRNNNLRKEGTVSLKTAKEAVTLKRTKETVSSIQIYPHDSPSNELLPVGDIISISRLIQNESESSYLQLAQTTNSSNNNRALNNTNNGRENACNLSNEENQTPVEGDIHKTTCNYCYDGCKTAEYSIDHDRDEIPYSRLNEINKDDDNNENVDIRYGPTSIKNNKKLKPIYKIESKTINDSKEVTTDREQILQRNNNLRENETAPLRRAKETVPLERTKESVPFIQIYPHDSPSNELSPVGNISISSNRLTQNESESSYLQLAQTTNSPNNNRAVNDTNNGRENICNLSNEENQAPVEGDIHKTVRNNCYDQYKTVDYSIDHDSDSDEIPYNFYENCNLIPEDINGSDSPNIKKGQNGVTIIEENQAPVEGDIHKTVRNNCYDQCKTVEYSIGHDSVSDEIPYSFYKNCSFIPEDINGSDSPNINKGQNDVPIIDLTTSPDE